MLLPPVQMLTSLPQRGGLVLLITGLLGIRLQYNVTYTLLLLYVLGVDR